MWNHTPEMRLRMADRRIPWPRFTAEEIANLIQFLSGNWKEPAAARPAAQPARR
jgi:hypothetical protein